MTTGPIIQRFLLIHLRLPELCTGNELGESASNQEVSEQILYFHSEDKELTTRTTQYDSDSSHCCSEEAIQFAGICQALFSLPSSIDRGEQSQDDDGTRVVHLEKSFLVFEIVEPPNVLAAAQTSRRSTPAAVGAAIQRAHQLFCFLRGGGVVHRLGLSSTQSSGQESMKLLYDLRKQERRLQDLLKRQPLDDRFQRELGSTRRELASFLANHPITSLRSDLRIHYESFLGDMTLLSTESCGSCRSIVENVPAPIAMPSGRHAFSSPPFMLNPFEFARLVAVVRGFLSEQEVDDEKSSHVVAVSTFVQGNFVATHSTSSFSGDLSNKTVGLIMRYLSSHLSKIRKNGDTASSSGTSTPKAKRAFRPFSIPLPGQDDNDVVEEEEQQTARCFYMKPPPLSLLSMSDDTYDFEGPRESRVWMPCVSLESSSKAGGGRKSFRVCLCQADCMSFLVFLSIPTKEEDDQTYRRPLTAFEDSLTRMQNDLQPRAEDSVLSDGCRFVSHCQTRQWDELGQDVIIIDRETHTLTLFLHKVDEKDPSLKRRFFAPQQIKQPHRSDPSEMLRRSSLGLDCRYFLASHLSLDTLLAFDDAMKELGCFRTSRKAKKSCMCTLLSQQWVYAYTDGSRDLFVFLDPKLHVTVADVQHSVEKIQSNLMGGAAHQQEQSL